jgi:hypothetical protein
MSVEAFLFHLRKMKSLLIFIRIIVLIRFILVGPTLRFADGNVGLIIITFITFTAASLCSLRIIRTRSFILSLSLTHISPIFTCQFVDVLLTFGFRTRISEFTTFIFF